VRPQRLAGAGDVRQVGLARLGQGRRHADDDGVGVAEAARVGGGVEAAAGPQLGHPLRADVADVALAPLQLGHLVGVDVEAEHRVAAPGERLRQRQPDVAEADDAHAGRALLQARLQLFGERSGPRQFQGH
jgi:hypothetical protein